MNEKRKIEDVNGEHATSVTDGQATRFLGPEEAEKFQARWEAVQVGFVDDPRQSAEQANGLVAEVTKRLAEIFADEQAKLESQWHRGGDVSTEDLRLVLLHYRSFFIRLLSV